MIQPTPPVDPAPPIPPPSPPPYREARIDDVLFAAFKALGYALSARALLLLTLLGAFVLAVLAIEATTWRGLGVCIAYGVLVVLPMVWLEIRKKPD